MTHHSLGLDSDRPEALLQVPGRKDGAHRSWHQPGRLALLHACHRRLVQIRVQVRGVQTALRQPEGSVYQSQRVLSRGGDLPQFGGASKARNEGRGPKGQRRRNRHQVAGGVGRGEEPLRRLEVREAAGAGPEPERRAGLGVGRGLDEDGPGFWGSRSPRWVLSAVERFSGYAVRYLKPDVTQNWRVGKGARRPGPGGREEAAAGVHAPRAYGSPSLWLAPVLHQPEPQPGPLRTEAPAF